MCLLVLVGFLAITRWIRGELRESYSQVVEENLVDYAHLFSAYVEKHRMSGESFATIDEMFKSYKAKKMDARIFDFVKANPSLEMYITDDFGRVVFSTKPEEVGRDYYRWNDVYRTLKGSYGARSTRIDKDDPRTSVFFVASPIVIDGKIAGVVSISKTEGSILIFLDRALNKMFYGGLFSVIALGLIGGLLFLWITLPLEKLRAYALGVSEGNRDVLPKSNIKEVKHLGEAFEKMRISLEGKKTVERYTQTLTHELKSPLTAIKGAAELCLEEMDKEQQTRFLKNIIDEANRSHSILEQLLKIAALESKQQLDNPEELDVVEILNEAKAALMGMWEPKKIQIDISQNVIGKVLGEKFLLFQAFRNVIQNAIEFSETGGKVEITVKNEGSKIHIEILDHGVGIPEFARERIFEKFYSLERPDTKKKSSGLGLSFVKEVIELHKGRIELTSPVIDGHGAVVLITL